MAEAEYIEQRQYAENQAEMLKFMVSMIQNLLMIEVSYQMTK